MIEMRVAPLVAHLRKRIKLGVALAPIVAACEPTAGASHVRSQAGDTIVVDNVGPAFDTAHVRLAFRVGEAEGPVERTFSVIWALAVHRDHVYAYDRAEGIREYDGTGRFVRNVARIGHGPTEAWNVRTMAVSEGGDLAVQDIGNRKVAVFVHGGGVKTWPFPAGKPRYHEDAVFFDRAGIPWVGFHPDPERQAGSTRPAFVRLGGRSAESDTLRVPLEPFGDCTTRTDRAHAVGFWDDDRRPWLPMLEWTAGPAGELAFGCASNYPILIKKPNGSLLRVSRSLKPVELTSDQRSFISTMALHRSSPSTRPAFGRIIIPADGRIWVWLNQALVPGSRGGWTMPLTGAFDVFEANGEWRGVVKLPGDIPYNGIPNTPNLVIRGDTIWAVTRDSMEVQYIGKYVIEWPAPLR